MGNQKNESIMIIKTAVNSHGSKIKQDYLFNMNNMVSFAC